MKKLFISATILIFSFGITETLSSQPAEEFINRRKEVIKRMEPGSVLILRSSPMAGMFDYARQGGNIFYLTGIDEPYCMLVLFAENFQMPAAKFTEGNEIFFIRPTNSDSINWDPQTLGFEGARTRSGIGDIRSV